MSGESCRIASYISPSIAEYSHTENQKGKNYLKRKAKPYES